MDTFGEVSGHLIPFGIDPNLHFAMESERAPLQFVTVQRK